MRALAHQLKRALGCGLLAVLAVACGGDGSAPATGAASGPAVRSGAGTAVEDHEAALAAVRAHLSRIMPCQSARTRFEEDFARDRFTARQITQYGLQSQSPVWEVELDAGLHIPYVSWFVEQSDGTVLASISAATYYESPLLFMCR